MNAMSKDGYFPLQKYDADHKLVDVFELSREQKDNLARITNIAERQGRRDGREYIEWANEDIKAKAAASSGKLWTDSDTWDEAIIPPRPWLARGKLLRGSVTILSGAGGVSKSSLAVAWAVSLAFGQTLGRFIPECQGTTLLLNAEDDRDEQRRRLSATLRAFGKSTADPGLSRIIRAGVEGVSTLIQKDKEGKFTSSPAMVAIEELVRQRKPDLIVFDPLVELHDADENDNSSLREVIARFRELARQSNAAVLLIHHSRKGSGASPGDPDTARGASSIIGAARVVVTLTGMQQHEAAQFGLSGAAACHYFRADVGKSNYAPLHGGEWFERQAFDLANGDSVAAPVPWQPPQDAAGVETIDAIVAGIGQASPTGEPWSPQLTRGNMRSVINLFIEHGVTTKAGQQKLLVDLTSRHGVVSRLFQDGNRNTVKGLRTAGGMPAAAWKEGDDAGE